MTKSKGNIECPGCTASISRTNKSRHQRVCPNKIRENKVSFIDAISEAAGLGIPDVEELIPRDKKGTEKARSLSPESQHISNDDDSFEVNTTYIAQSAHPIAR